MPYAFKYKRKHSRSHIYFHAKINKSETLIKGGGGVVCMFGFQGEHGLNGVKPWEKHHILKVKTPKVKFL